MDQWLSHTTLGGWRASSRRQGRFTLQDSVTTTRRGDGRTQLETLRTPRPPTGGPGRNGLHWSNLAQTRSNTATNAMMAGHLLACRAFESHSEPQDRDENPSDASFGLFSGGPRTKTAREPSRAACGANSRPAPLPFIACPNNKLGYVAVSTLPLFLHLELLNECIEMRRNGSSEAVVLVLQALPDC
jgi:hypothetical protein